MQQKNGIEVLRLLAKGSKEYFLIVVGDAGFQIFGNIKRTEDNFLDFRTILEEEGAVFLGKLIFTYLPLSGLLDWKKLFNALLDLSLICKFIYCFFSLLLFLALKGDGKESK